MHLRHFSENGVIIFDFERLVANGAGGDGRDGTEGAFGWMDGRLDRVFGVWMIGRMILILGVDRDEIRQRKHRHPMILPVVAISFCRSMVDPHTCLSTRSASSRHQPGLVSHLKDTQEFIKKVIWYCSY